MESKREYLLFSAEVLADAVNDGMMSIDDYAFAVVARGLRRLDAENLADLLRKETTSKACEKTIVELVYDLMFRSSTHSEARELVSA